MADGYVLFPGLQRQRGRQVVDNLPAHFIEGARSKYRGGTAEFHIQSAYRHFGLHYNQSPSIRSTAFNYAALNQKTAQWIFDFADRIPLDPTALFLIRGRKFLCEKIETSLTDYGIEPVKRGYFYEVE